MKTTFFYALLALLAAFSTQKDFPSDVIPTGEGDLEMTFIGHGTLMFTFKNLVIHIDPTMREADYAELPDADLVLVTHHHGDHLDLTALEHVMKEGCQVVMTRTCLEQLEDFKQAILMGNGDRKTLQGIQIEAIPAYNIVHKRSNGQPYHPKGLGNAYVLTMGGKRILIGGDTENVPEIKALKNIDVAFLPMNVPYTMTPEMVADAARAIQPGILYPYHYGNTDPELLVELLEGESDIEVRIRDLR